MKRLTDAQRAALVNQFNADICIVLPERLNEGLNAGLIAAIDRLTHETRGSPQRKRQANHLCRRGRFIS